MSRTSASIGLFFLSVCAGCGDDDVGGTPQPLCDEAALTSALATATSGSTVRVGACTITGSFTVPAGVSLVGAGVAQSRIVATRMMPAITITPATPATSVSDITVESAGDFGIVARGNSAVVIEDVVADVRTGAGIGIENATSATLRNVSVEGAYDTPAMLNALPAALDGTMHATHGIVLVRVADATLEMVDVGDVAHKATLFVESDVTWSGGGVTNTRGTGIDMHGGVLSLTGISVTGLVRGADSLPSYAITAVTGRMDSSSLDVHDNEGVGLMVVDVPGTHTDLTANANGDVGVWVQETDGFAIQGVGSIVSNNAFAGIVLINSMNARLDDVRVERNTMGMGHPPEATPGMPISAGDGVHLVASATGTHLTRVRFLDNERIGLLVDAGGAAVGPDICSAVMVSSSGTQLGAKAQNGMIDPGWAMGLTRAGAATTNDPAFMMTLPIAGVIGPIDSPTDDGASAMGIGGVIGPID